MLIRPAVTELLIDDIRPVDLPAHHTCSQSRHLHLLPELPSAQPSQHLSEHLHKYVLLNDQIKMFEASKISSNANIKVCYFRPLI